MRHNYANVGQLKLLSADVVLTQVPRDRHHELPLDLQSYLRDLQMPDRIVHSAAVSCRHVRCVVVLRPGLMITGCGRDVQIVEWAPQGSASPMSLEQPLATLRGHVDHVLGLADMLDMDHIASCSGDRTVIVWSLVERKQIVTLAGHTHAVQDVVCVRPDTLVSCSEDETVRVWDWQRGTCTAVLTGHTGAIRTLHPMINDCNLVLSGAHDGTMRVWDLRDNSQVSVMRQPYIVNACADLGDGVHVVCAYYKTVAVWNWRTQRMVGTLQGHSLWINAVAALGDGVHAVSGACDGCIRVWDCTTGACKAMLSRSGACDGAPVDALGVLFQNDTGRKLIALADTSAVSVFDTVTFLQRDYVQPAPSLGDVEMQHAVTGAVVSSASAAAAAATAAMSATATKQRVKTFSGHISPSRLRKHFRGFPRRH